MDKNTIIGLLLIAGILFTFTLVTEPEPVDEETKTETVVEDGLDRHKREEVEDFTTQTYDYVSLWVVFVFSGLS